MANDTERANDAGLRGMGSDYAMLGAQSDPGVVAISRLLSSKFGGAESMIKDIVVLLQSMVGLQNKGLAGATSALGGIQNYGASSMMTGGNVGMISGRDVASYYAAQAVQQEIMKQFTGPNGLPNSRAHGLNAEQMGQAAGMAFSTGQQYAGGAMFQSQHVTNELKNKLLDEARRSGNGQAIKDAENLQPGSIRQVINPAGKQQLVQMMDDANATLGAIRDVMGSSALKNLDRTMSELFGGRIQDFGMQAARMRMTQIKTLGSSFFGGGVAGSRDAAAALSATGDAVLSGLAPGMGADEARLRYGALGQHAAIYAVRMAAAGGRASAMNQGIAAGAGFYTKGTEFSQIAQESGQQLGQYMNEETEQLAMEFMMQQNGGGTVEQQQQAAALRQKMAEAGADPAKIREARLSMESFIGGAAGMTSGQYLAQSGGAAKVRELLGPAAAMSLAATGSAALNGRNQDLLKDAFKNDTSLQKQYGISAGQAGFMGHAVANLDALTVQDIGKILKDGGGAEGIAEYLKLHPDAATALGEVGVDTQRFAEMMGREGSSKMIHQMHANYRNYAGVRIDSRMDHNRNVDAEMTAFNRDHQQGNNPSRGDFWEELTKGLTGTKEYTAQEAINRVNSGRLTETDEAMKAVVIKQLGMSGNMLTGEGGDIDTLNGILNDTERSSLGMPSDPKAMQKWLKNKDNNQMVQTLLSKKGAYSVSEGRASWMSSEDRDTVNNMMSREDLNSSMRKLTGDDFYYDAESMKGKNGAIDNQKLKAAFDKQLNEGFSVEEISGKLLGAADEYSGDIALKDGQIENRSKFTDSEKMKDLEEYGKHLSGNNRARAIDEVNKLMEKNQKQLEASTAEWAATGNKEGSVEELKVRTLKGRREGLTRDLDALQGTTAQRHMTVTNMIVTTLTNLGKAIGGV